MSRTSLVRPIAVAALAAVILLFSSEPALAFGAAGQAITSSVCEAVGVAKKVLITAATLAVMVGLAPMLWGEVKVRWIISSAVFCVLVNAVTAIVGAFAGTGAC